MTSIHKKTLWETKVRAFADVFEGRAFNSLVLGVGMKF